MYSIERSQVIPAPRKTAFRYFEDPHNLSKITPPWLGFEVLKVDGLPLRAGTRVEYRIRWLGLPVRWRTLITEYEQGRRFVDVQAGGPYRHWRHEHLFEDAGAGTLIRDRVEYELPFGSLGKLVHRLLVARQLRRIFDYREEKIRDAFPAGAGGARFPAVAAHLKIPPLRPPRAMRSGFGHFLRRLPERSRSGLRRKT